MWDESKNSWSKKILFVLEKSHYIKTRIIIELNFIIAVTLRIAGLQDFICRERYFSKS